MYSQIFEDPVAVQDMLDIAELHTSRCGEVPTRIRVGRYFAGRLFRQGIERAFVMLGPATITQIVLDPALGANEAATDGQGPRIWTDTRRRPLTR